MNGIINILKPSGISSNKVLNLVKRKFKNNKVGHFGTLDPMACGVLPVAVGKATRLFDYFLNKDKIYIATFKFGLTTETLDSEGKIIEEHNDVKIIKDEILEILPKFIGKIEQVPPIYSAINLKGAKAYELARKGIEVEMPTKIVQIYNIEILNEIAENTFLFKIHCSSGTYIRSLARDIAKALNTVGYMPQLIRTKAGSFKIENSFTIDEIENDQFQLEKIENIVDLKRYDLPSEYYDRLKNGVKINSEFITNNDFLLFCKNELFGIACIENNFIKIKSNLRG